MGSVDTDNPVLCIVCLLVVFSMPACDDYDLLAPVDSSMDGDPVADVQDVDSHDIDTYDVPGEPDATVEDMWDAMTDVGEDVAPEPGSTGTACTEDDDCTGVPGTGRFCMDRLEAGGGYGMDFPGGYCSAECDSADDCGVGADCLDLGYLGHCMRRCSSSVECRESEGYVCSEIPFITTETYCVPYM
jgi:hypothetical protein